MSKAKRTEFNCIHALQDHARSLIVDGYVVLVATASCGHWIGYSAFKVIGGVEDSHLLTFAEEVDVSGIDPKLIYEIN